MRQERFSSKDFYHTLVLIERKVRALPCRGIHEDDAKYWHELLDFIQNERDTMYARALVSEQLRVRREKKRTEGQEDGMPVQ